MALDPDHVIETFEAAREENRLSKLRAAQVVHLPEEGEVWMTGDIHDNRQNFDKLLAAADLGAHPQRHLVLHELIHGEGIMKAGLSVCEAFTAGVKRDFGKSWSSVNVTLTDFLLSLPLAIRTHNGLFFCHSLPTDKEIDSFDYSVFEREELTAADYRRRTGPVYQLIWGRHMTPATVDAFAEQVGARLIVTGHQPQDSGYLVNGDKHLILASDHNQGVFLPLDLAEHYDMVDLVSRLRKFVSLKTVDEDPERETFDINDSDFDEDTDAA